MEGVIPQCSECHTGEPHFELERCLKCHSNPHAPLCLKPARKITKPYSIVGELLSKWRNGYERIL
jgi:hypothetical protein